MHPSAWIALIRQFPQSVHENLTFITRTGSEVAVQNIFRIEPDYIVLRGRLSGTTDEGRVFVLPFDEVHALGFQKPMKEHEVEAVFSGRDPRQTAEQRAVEAADLAPAAEAPAPAPASQEPPAAAKAPQPTPPPASAPVEVKDTKPQVKVPLLERVRARLAAANEGKTAGPS
jgi:hypothetical protein